MQVIETITKEQDMISLTTQKITKLSDPKSGRGIWHRITGMMSISRQRRALAELDEHLLNDIGVDRYRALTEAQKPSWDVPSHWHR